MNVEVVLTAMSSEKVLADPMLHRRYATQGLFESLGLLANASLLAAVQAMLWGVARRRAAAGARSTAPDAQRSHR